MGTKRVRGPRKAASVSLNTRSLFLAIALLLAAGIAAASSLLLQIHEVGSVPAYESIGEMVLSVVLFALSARVLLRLHGRMALWPSGESEETPRQLPQSRIQIHDEDRWRSAVELEVTA